MDKLSPSAMYKDKSFLWYGPIFRSIVGGVTCLKLQHKLQNSVDPKQTVVVEALDPTAETIGWNNSFSILVFLEMINSRSQSFFVWPLVENSNITFVTYSWSLLRLTNNKTWWLLCSCFDQSRCRRQRRDAWKDDAAGSTRGVPGRGRGKTMPFTPRFATPSSHMCMLVKFSTRQLTPKK